MRTFLNSALTVAIAAALLVVVASPSFAQTTSVPEPGSLSLFASAIVAGLYVIRRKR